jgi:aminomethyltransferase
MRSVLFDDHKNSGARFVEIHGWEVPDVFASVEAEYAAAHVGAVVHDAAPRGRLRLTGRTRIDFVHRMSTNDLNALQPGQGAATVLTTAIARIVDRVVVLVREDDALLLTSHGAQATVAAWLLKYVFFNDDVQIHDASAEPGMFSVYGARANEVAARLAGGDVSGLSLHHWQTFGEGAWLVRADPIAGDGYHVLAQPSVLAPLWRTAIELGASPIGERALEVLRIESGVPRYGRELSEAYIPLEAGLWPDVSFSKGCYIGQEIIARMESRHRLAKQLVGLRARAPIEPGAKIAVDRVAVGGVSSAAVRPNGDSIALGFVKPSQATPGTQVSIGDGAPVNGEVVALPIPRGDLNDA